MVVLCGYSFIVQPPPSLKNFLDPSLVAPHGKLGEEEEWKMEKLHKPLEGGKGSSNIS
jgi:hypothetical protein